MTAASKLAVVTGTSGGLGRAIAVELTREDFKVIGISRRPVESLAISDVPGQYEHLCWDLGRIDDLKELVDRIMSEHGKPFALVNNAAVGTDGLLPTMHNREIQDLVTLNVTSPMVLSKYLVRPMLSQRGGRIVNISSIVAHTGYRGLAAYGATKAALEGFTRSLARDVGARGVTVNAVAPGFLETDMTGGLAQRDLDRIKNRAALRRFALTDDVAAAVSFLLSDRAASITGTTVTVDGGSTA